MEKKKIIGLIIGGILLATAINFGIIFRHGTQVLDIGDKSAAVTKRQNPDYFSYKGEAGKNALELLQKQAKITENGSGLITSINGLKADDTKHEYWGFYVNGKLADVGPKLYVTKDTDFIEWKITKY